MQQSVPQPSRAATQPALTSADLRAFLNEDAQDARRTRLLANIARRAETLFTTDGYTVKPFTHNGQGFPGLFIVTKPETENELGWSEFGGCYAVKCAEDFHTCTCPCFEEWGECKHHLAVKNMIAEDAALDAQAEREEEANAFFAEVAARY